MPDWFLIFNFLQNIALQINWDSFFNIISKVATAITCGVVIYNIPAWRREFLGKREIELAEDVLAMFYEAVDRVSFMRSPFGHQGEGSTRQSDPSETPKQKIVRDKAFVLLERYNKHSEFFNKLHSTRYKFKARFGPKAEKPFNDLHKIITDLFHASRMLSVHWERQGEDFDSKEGFQEHLDSMWKYEALIWERPVGQDPIKPRLESIINEIEAIFEPKLLKS